MVGIILSAWIVCTALGVYNEWIRRYDKTGPFDWQVVVTIYGSVYGVALLGLYIWATYG